MSRTDFRPSRQNTLSRNNENHYWFFIVLVWSRPRPRRINRHYPAGKRSYRIRRTPSVPNLNVRTALFLRAKIKYPYVDSIPTYVEWRASLFHPVRVNVRHRSCRVLSGFVLSVASCDPRTILSNHNRPPEQWWTNDIEWKWWWWRGKTSSQHRQTLYLIKALN